MRHPDDTYGLALLADQLAALVECHHHAGLAAAGLRADLIHHGDPEAGQALQRVRDRLITTGALIGSALGLLDTLAGPEPAGAGLADVAGVQVPEDTAEADRGELWGCSADPVPHTWAECPTHHQR